MEGGFLSIERTENTAVIVALNFQILAFYNVSCVQSIHEKKPGEHFQLVIALGFPEPDKMSRWLDVFEREMVEFARGVSS